MMTLDQWRDLLVAEATNYDRKQTGKRGYNIWALNISIESIDEALKVPDFLADPRKALASEFIIRGETGGIYHRNIPRDLTVEKFVLPWINAALKKAKV